MHSFEESVRLPQNKLKRKLISELTGMKYKTLTKKGFIYAKGDVPVMLVAHLDTVHKETVRTICRSADGNVLMSPQGIGGDDRNGVYMILRIIRNCRCHVLFCEDEEIGVVGAREFARSGIEPDVKYIVELDRRGSNDAVFYDCENPDFTKFITGFGFKEQQGSFSDISVIAPHLGIAAVNISAGYFCEHTRHEYVDMHVMNKNVERVAKMVSAPAERFDYLETVYSFKDLLGGRYYEDVWDFERYYGFHEEMHVELLMPLPETAYVKKPDGELEECDGQYMIDRTGRLFEYLADLGVAIEIDNMQAISGNGWHVRFKENRADWVEVVPLDYILEAYLDS